MTGDLDLCCAFLDAHPSEAAQVLERLGAVDAALLLESMPPGTSARVLERVTPLVAAEGLSHMRPAAGAALVAELRLDQGAALLRRVDDALQTRILETLPQAEAHLLRVLLRYPEHTAGALMDPRAFAVGDDMTAADALGMLRRTPNDVVDEVFVTDRTQRLVGVVGLRELLLARPADPVAGIMTGAANRLGARTGRPGVLAHPGWRQHRTLPVVDEESRLVGAVRYETFRALEDAARGAAQGPDAVATVFALGELYWLGLSGVVDALASVVKRTPLRAGDSGEASHGGA